MIALIAVSGDADAVETARAKLDDTIRGLAFFGDAMAQSWVDPAGTGGAAWVISKGGHVVGESAFAGSSHAAFVLGRPIRWVGERAEGLDVLDAERMAAVDPAQLAREMDGRGLLVRVDAGGITVVGDPMHGYPLWSWQRGMAPEPGRTPGGPLWVTNLPGVLHRAGAPQHTLDARRIAGAVAYGSSYDGAPWWTGTRRITGWCGAGPRHPRLRQVSAAPSMRELAAMHGRGDTLDAADAARVLVEITRAMGERAGRDLVVPVSAGKDSRLILAAALAADLPFRSVTGGARDSSDFVVGRALSHAAGVPHLRIGDAQATRSTRPVDTIAMVATLSAGVATAADAHFFPHGPSGLASTWLSGQAGEIARAFYGRALGPGTAPAVLLRTLSRRPGRSSPLTAAAEAQFARTAWARLRDLRGAGARSDALGDVYYVTDRMARHLGGALIHFELGLDYASPLWTRRMLPSMWAGTPEQRLKSTFHDEVTRALVAARPASTRTAFEDAIAAGAVPEEPVEPGGRVDAALVSAQAHVASRAGRLEAGDPLWKILSRRRTLALSQQDPADLDFIERQHVWRVATVLHAWTEQADG